MLRSKPGPRWETPDPPGVAGTYGKLVRAWALRELGIKYGRWQAHAIDNALRYDKKGDLIHQVVLLSTGRQNGKSIIVRGLFGWLLDEGQALPPFAGWTTILAAAHDAKQARIIYKGVYSDLSSITRLRGSARLTEHFGITVGGLTLDTVTGQPGSARGLSAGALAWDEMLTQRDWDMWEALAPTQSAQRSPIMVLTSTAGMADSVILRSFYDRLRREAAGDEKPDPAFYGAWWQSESPDVGLDWVQIKQANPALGDGRLSRGHIKGLHRTLPADSWRREVLNHFVDVTVHGAFNPGVWAALRTSDPLKDVDPPFALGVDIQPGWERAAIVAAAIRPDGRLGAEVYRDLRAAEGDSLSADQIRAAIRAFPDPVSRVTFSNVSGGAASFGRFATTAEAFGVDWIALKPHEEVAADMDLTEMIISGRLAVDDPLLDAQIPLTARRPVGQDGAFRFSRKDSGPIDAIKALSFAVNGVVSVVPLPHMT